MRTYYATVDGKWTNERKTDRTYTHGVVAIFPNGDVRLVSCHFGREVANTAALKSSEGKGGTVVSFRAYKNGARFVVEPLITK